MKIAIALFTALVALTGAATPAHAALSPDSIVGVFTFEGRSVNCSTGEPTHPTARLARSVTVYNAGGTLQSSGQYNPKNSPTYGTWDYDTVASEHVIASTTDVYGNNSLKFIIKTEQRLKLSENGNDATAKDTVKTLDSTGKVLSTRCMTRTGVRSL